MLSLLFYIGLSRDDVNVVELHDCFSCNELITYEALGLCPPGKHINLVGKLQFSVFYNHKCLC